MNFCKSACQYSLWGIRAQLMAEKVALLDLRHLRLQRLNRASMNLLQTPLKDGFLSSPSFIFLMLYFHGICLSPHTPNQENSRQRSPETNFFGECSQCWCEILINHCLQYVSYSSLTRTCLEYSKAAVWSLLQQGFATEQPQSCFSTVWSGSTSSRWHLK